MAVYVATGEEFTVNSKYARSQAHADTARLADGKLVTIWVDADFNTTANRFIRAQIFEADGSPSGVELTLGAISSPP